MGPQRPDEAAFESPRNVVQVEWGDGQRVGERTAALRPRLERRRQQDEEATAVDRAGDFAERVRLEFVVTVDSDDVPRGPEEVARVDLSALFTPESILGSDERRAGDRDREASRIDSRRS